jgi:hypothetical protein
LNASILTSLYTHFLGLYAELSVPDWLRVNGQVGTIRRRGGAPLQSAPVDPDDPRCGRATGRRGRISVRVSLPRSEQAWSSRPANC